MFFDGTSLKLNGSLCLWFLFHVCNWPSQIPQVSFCNTSFHHCSTGLIFAFSAIRDFVNCFRLVSLLRRTLIVSGHACRMQCTSWCTRKRKVTHRTCFANRNCQNTDDIRLLHPCTPKYEWWNIMLRKI
jgi:hypothetical protein